ncbi:hypothetical protein HA402_013808 [Bradysia odoriphaga]|nr:hypothetical protein HA402_013808 [Bradysia odoriphaga]
MEKRIAAETKKQNTLKAQKILDELKREVAKSQPDRVSKSSNKKPEKDKPVRSNKKEDRNKDISVKPKRSYQDNVLTTKTELAMQSISNSTASSVSGFVDPSDCNETPPNGSVSDQGKSIPISKESGLRKSTGNGANKKSAVRSHGFGYQYEIDCQHVSDSIDVNDLKMHLEKHLKIKGKKENFGSTVSIVCKGQKVVINSETFFPKKSLRFLSKKFLKKNWNIRVLSKNVHSYEYIQLNNADPEPRPIPQFFLLRAQQEMEARNAAERDATEARNAAAREATEARNAAAREAVEARNAAAREATEARNAAAREAARRNNYYRRPNYPQSLGFNQQPGFGQSYYPQATGFIRQPGFGQSYYPQATGFNQQPGFF